MAIDSEDKRRSVQAYTLGVMRPSPDGAIGVGDRATSAWFYSGLSYSASLTSLVARARHALGNALGLSLGS